MPQEHIPTPAPYIPWDAPETPYKFSNTVISDVWAVQLVNDTLDWLEQWRLQNCDERWKQIDRLYQGARAQKFWPGTRVPRASFSAQIAWDQVESAEAALYQEILAPSDLLSVEPEGGTTPLEAAQIQDRLRYILDHNIDDYGWNARAELGLTLKDDLMYGNCFGLVEWDEDRQQATVLRVDPRDVYVDPATPSPYIEQARARVVHRVKTIDELNSMRGFPNFRIPSKDTLTFLARSRTSLPQDNTFTSAEAARGVSYVPGADDFLPFPADKLVDLWIYMGKGREIWILGRGKYSACVYNELEPYGCSRLVSAPCVPVPNRFYAQSYVDVLDGIQRLMSGIISKYADAMSLELDPPRVGKRGVARGANGLTWRPGGVMLTDNPKEDLIVHPPSQAMTANIWPMISYLQDQAHARTGQNSMSMNGTPGGHNADRTRGGVMAQMQAPATRLARVAHNYTSFFLTPLMYKLLKVEKLHASGQGPIYARRG